VWARKRVLGLNGLLQKGRMSLYELWGNVIEDLTL
jgi:hypothetical protein